LWNSLDEAKKQILWGLSHADVVKISDEEVEFLFGIEPSYGAEYIMSHYNTKLVFVTCGAKGCYYKNAVAEGFMPAVSGIDVADTTGAGDVFAGSVVSRLLACEKSPELLDKTELDDIASFACANAGLSTTKSGGISGIPAIEDVLEFLAGGK
jgi:fructokinase